MKDDCSCAKARVLPVKNFLDEGIWYDDNHDDNQSTHFALIGQGILHMRRSSYSHGEMQASFRHLGLAEVALRKRAWISLGVQNDCSRAKARVLPVRHFLDEGIWYNDR